MSVTPEYKRLVEPVLLRVQTRAPKLIEELVKELVKECRPLAPSLTEERLKVVVLGAFFGACHAINLNMLGNGMPTFQTSWEAATRGFE